MNKSKSNKKRLIISYEKLSEDIKELFKEEYADGYSQYIQKIEKPTGEIIFVVPLETEDTTFMIKVDVRVDSKFSEEEIEKEIFALPKESEADFSAELEENEDKEDHKEFELKHGDYEDIDGEKSEENDEEGEGEEEEDES